MKKVLILLSVALGVISCKNSDITADYSFTSTQDNSEMEKAFDGLGSVANDAVENEGAGSSTNREKKGFVHCWNTATLNSTFDTLTLTFNGTTCHDGQSREGTMIVAFTGGYREEGTVITTTLEDFYLNGERLEGKRVTTNQGRNSSGSLVYEIVVTDGKLTKEDGTVLTWASNRTREWISGETTPLNVYDDIYEIYGSANGVNSEGLSYTMSVQDSDPILWDANCWLSTRLPKSGTITVSPEGLDDRFIDYGNGSCDRTVIVGVGDQSFTLTL